MIQLEAAVPAACWLIRDAGEQPQLACFALPSFQTCLFFRPSISALKAETERLTRSARTLCSQRAAVPDAGKRPTPYSSSLDSEYVNIISRCVVPTR